VFEFHEERSALLSFVGLKQLLWECFGFLVKTEGAVVGELVADILPDGQKQSIIDDNCQFFCVRCFLLLPVFIDEDIGDGVGTTDV
jgi:hypothetical protein